ncbi:MAG: taurine dioxygenase [Acidimicrobiales bacterium]|jgi:taurine dioxygenase
MRITPLSDAIGAEITDVDLNQLDDDGFDLLSDTFHQHGVIFVRDQQLSPEQHVAFAERWAPIDINRFFKPVDGHPKIAEVLKEPTDDHNIGGGWHTDHSYDVEPAMGSLLFARDIPDTGGDTLFASPAAAYDALSEGFKQMLAPLVARHSNEHVFGAAALKTRELGDRIGNPDAAGQTAEHPLVITHPLSGRQVLYVNPGFTTDIVGWNGAESKALLRFLYDHITQPQFTIRFKWAEGTLAFWDNRACWHYALNDYPGKRRHLHRITVAGSALAA